MIPLDALGYRHPGSDLRLEFGSSAKHSVSYRLSHDSDYLGELIFRRRQRLGEEEQRQLESLLGTLLFPLRNALLYRAAIQTALRDALTGTGNRIAMDQALGRELELARRNLQPLSVLMLDIDHFKRVNDHYGHAVGDEALKAVAETIKDHLRMSTWCSASAARNSSSCCPARRCRLPAWSANVCARRWRNWTTGMPAKR